MVIHYKNKYRIYGELISIHRFTSYYTIDKECAKCPLNNYCLNELITKDIILNEIMSKCSYNELIGTSKHLLFSNKYSLFIRNISLINMHKLLL